ncbi:MAG: hypothetical protein A3G52_01575 [Candidatus Taylorbacteria bacterium RIFCSPLOWO2_12_FULL_43_20]|uniref:ECF transporter S component n=1 Tax=Candidatus Taylorbacteria bacterium RIFCSPLOWO2_12_FULL_43_20 TaxID=1802332 RepID=A0A1G2NZ33_9BACT|nr:MAG: hypothetical protein A2825_02145 [Candidatus Taylorbacteria bacterium RIFCSPHIGHO2_01_FULL_43_120]OHA23943.1 MAG: hypothetical protein A3B98_03845 [Candidatus Taylorbacteria bacterium RIFCSPHIGHO2_02_FULL_43_55]OHA29395.1 MAG: hypothetical protein A3E92_02555 [Candidatus Taylorbacteria bacterium RIFCSPHIGHO2_12_FULL_42_34]OHA31771.1 MAG: hypothetical protein A3B09_01995 [Candidatus Taylorbacteria bacterium RIFCSPLOWO2_01_FULL_43_83]OHA37631.1 MAG: hypothetical protein A3H58_00305 [Candi
MSKKNFLITTILLLAVGLLGRLIPHPWNMTPITAIALFGSARFGFKYSLMLVFAVMLITDAFIGFYDWQIMLSVYASFGMVALIGLCIKKRERAPSVILGAVSSSLLFFLVTNWAVWQFGTMYSPGLVGLAQSYVMALPFFQNMLIGDVIYSGAIFGAFAFLEKGNPFLKQLPSSSSPSSIRN